MGVSLGCFIPPTCPLGLNTAPRNDWLLVVDWSGWQAKTGCVHALTTNLILIASLVKFQGHA